MRLTAEQERYMQQITETLGEHVLITPNELARLTHKNLFKTNMHRLCKKVLSDTKRGLHDLEFMVANLPDSYKKKLMSSNEWNTFIWRMQFESRKKEPDEVIKSLDALYDAFENVNKHIPKELRYPVARSLGDFAILLEGVLNNSQKQKGKARVIVKLPEGLELRTHIG